MSLDLAHAAVHVDLHAGDVGGVVGSKEGHGAGDFFGLADALHGHARDDAAGKFIERFLGKAGTAEDGRFDGAGSDRVDANIASDEFRCQSSGERTQCCFCRGID